MASGVRILQDTNGAGLAALAKRLEAGRHSVLVGLPAGKGHGIDSGLSVAEVGAWLEFGTWNAPERPWLRPGILKNLGAFRRLAQVDLVGIAEGRLSMDAALNRLGVFAVGRVQNEITHGPAVPNAPSTIAKKGSSVPRIDTGMVRQSVTYVVEGQAAAAPPALEAVG